MVLAVGELVGPRPGGQRPGRPTATAIRLPSAARAAVLAISSRARSQGSPMPRCEVSIASATPNPCAHK